MNAPIAILIWLMIYPMMLKIDFAGIKGVARKPAGLIITLFVNWLIKLVAFAPIVMFLLGVADVIIPSAVLVTSVVVFIVIPLVAGFLSRHFIVRAKGLEWFERNFLSRFHSLPIFALLVTLTLVFAFLSVASVTSPRDGIRGEADQCCIPGE